jgi:hypothetical protein
MAELETFDPGDGGKKGKKGKKGTVNGKKVETAPNGAKYTVKDGKKIAISQPTTSQKGAISKQSETPSTKQIKKIEGTQDVSYVTPDIEQKAQYRVNYSDPQTGEKKSKFFDTEKEGSAFQATQSGYREGFWDDYGRTIKGGETVNAKAMRATSAAAPQNKTMPQEKQSGFSQKGKKEDTYTSVSKKPEFDAYASEKTEETMKTPGGDRVPLYRTKTGGEYIVQKGKKVMLKSSPTMTGGKQ